MKKSFFYIFFFYLLAWNAHAEKEFNINEYTAEENFKKGVYYYNETKFLSACEFFIKALQYTPDYYRAKVWLGRSYYKAGFIENAISEWQEAVDNGGADNILINRLNNIYYQLGRGKKVSPVGSYVNLKTIDGNSWDAARFVQPISIFINYDYEIFLTGLASGSVLHFDPNFNVIKNIKAGKKSFKMPFGFAMDSKGSFYVSDVKNEIIQKFNKNHEFQLVFGGRGVKDGEFLGPEAVCIDKQDNIYVADTGNCRVQKFTSDGKFLMKFGQRGEGPGEFFKPTGITLDQENNIFVSDNVRRNIQKFDCDGNFAEYMFEDKSFSDLRNIRYYEDYFLVADGVNGAYVYDKNNGTWLNFKHFNYSQNKLLSVSDLAFGKDRSLYLLDFYKNTLEIFVPETYKYGNLDPVINVVDISKYPKVALYCSVYKKDGSPVMGMGNENFSVKELGVKISPYNVVKSIYDNNKINMLFLVEKSFEMKKYNEDLKEAAGYIISDIFNTKDVVKVNNFHQKNWSSLDYSYQKLKILEAMDVNDYHYVTDVSKSLYSAVSELMNKLSRKVLVLFTAGEFDTENNFKNYDFEVCKNYAMINHVPVYIINFSRNNEEKLKELAHSTDGKYYYYFKDTGKLKNMRDDILKIPVNYYIITYETLRNKKLVDTWREVELEVNFNKLTGIDKTGYFVPSH